MSGQSLWGVGRRDAVACGGLMPGGRSGAGDMLCGRAHLAIATPRQPISLLCRSAPVTALREVPAVLMQGILVSIGVTDQDEVDAGVGGGVANLGVKTIDQRLRQREEIHGEAKLRGRVSWQTLARSWGAVTRFSLCDGES